MKFRKKLLLVLILLVAFVSYNVFAQEPTAENSFSHNDITYEIEKIHMDVYQSKLDEDGKYVGYEGDRLYSINLPDSVSITTSYEDSEDDNPDDNDNSIATLAHLQLGITKEEILALLQEEVEEVDEDTHYFIRMVVDFSFTEIPDIFEHVYQTTFLDRNNELNLLALLAQMMDTEEEVAAPMKMEEVDMDATQSQVFLCFEYKLEDEEAVLNYSQTYTEDMPVYIDLYVESASLSSLDEQTPYIIAGEGVEITDSEYTVVYSRNHQTITFFGYENTEDYINGLAEVLVGGYGDNDLVDDFINHNPLTGDTPQTTDEYAKIPNTAKFVGLAGLVIGLGIIITGITLIVLTLNSKKLKHQKSR